MKKRIEEWKSILCAGMKNVWHKLADKAEGNIPKLRLHSLAPVRLKNTDYKDYEDAFKIIRKDKTLNNIAITGEYGSGKSSVIETFLKKNFLLKHFTMRISLRNYDGMEEVGIHALEKRILNQIIMQMRLHNISGSGIYTKQHLRDGVKFSIFLLTWFGIMAGLYACVLVREPFVTVWKDNLFYNFLYDYDTKWRILLLLGAGFLYVIFRLLNQLPSGWFPDKVSCTYKDTELMVEKKGTTIDQALYDTYIDEIVYLLRRQWTLMLIIEDLDRYNNIDIFEQLREINFLINVKKNHWWSRKVKFIYLVKDSLFDNNGWDRTKFFDMIIPVAPCIGGAESWRKMKEMCPGLSAMDDNEKEKLDTEMETFFQLHLSDYRMLKNIANEFNIAYNRRQRVGIEIFDFDKMLGMLVYKNLFPLDWAELQRKRGYIYSCLQMDDELKKYVDENKDESQRYAYDKVFEDGFARADTLPRFPYMKKAYWERIKEHSEFDLLETVIKNGYIEKKDYEQYIRILSTEDVEVLNLRKYSYAIRHRMRTADLDFDTEISEKMWKKLSSQMKQDADYDNGALVNKDIIKHMLSSMRTSNNKWEERARLEDVVGYATDEELMKVYDSVNGTDCENWAAIIWDEDLFAWNHPNNQEQANYIFNYVVNAIKGDSIFDQINECYEDMEYSRSEYPSYNSDGEPIYPEDEPFLKYIFDKKCELYNKLQNDTAALCVLYKLIGFGAEPYRLQDVSIYEEDEHLLEIIWDTDSFEPTKENILILMSEVESTDMHLEKLKKIAPEIYDEWMRDENINHFVEAYYLRYLLKNVCGRGGRGFEEVRELLERDALLEEWKEKIIERLPERAYPIDLSVLSEPLVEKFIAKRKMGYSLNNIAKLLLAKDKLSEEELSRFVKNCYQKALKDGEDFPVFTMKLSAEEAAGMIMSIWELDIEKDIENWLFVQLDILVTEGKPGPEVA